VFVGLSLLVVAGLYFFAPEQLICDPCPDAAQKHYAAHHMPYFVVWYVGKFLDAHSGAIIGIATIALFIATYRLWKTTSEMVKRTDTAAANQLTAMQGQLDAMKAQEALLEKSLAAAAESAKAATAGASNAEASVGIAKRQFLSTVHPKLIVRQIDYVHDGDLPTVYYTIANVGGSDAEIIRTSIRAWTPPKNAEREWPGYPPYREASETVDQGFGMFISPGGTRRLPYQDYGEEWALLIGQVAKDNVDTILLGFIEYLDDTGRLRRVGFCRRRIPDSTRFEPVNDPDYEYSD